MGGALRRQRIPHVGDVVAVLHPDRPGQAAAGEAVGPGRNAVVEREGLDVSVTMRRYRSIVILVDVQGGL